jgi:hypothetical protein
MPDFTFRYPPPTWLEIFTAGVETTARAVGGGEGLIAAHGSILIVFPLKSLQKIITGTLLFVFLIINQ